MTYEAWLRDFAQREPDLVVMTAENRATIRALPSQLGERFIDVGICEQTLVGAAAGLALSGRVPVVHALASFLVMRAYEFIRTDIGIAGLPVKLVGYVPGFLSTANGPTHQAIEDVALMRMVPGMQIFCPSDRDELLAGLPALFESPNPCYVRYCDAPAPSEHRQPFVVGRAEQLAEGHDVTLLTYGVLLEEVADCARRLGRKGLSVGLINMRTLEPFDQEAVIEAARKSRLLVTVEDHFVRGGLYTILAECLLRHQMRAAVLPISLEQRWFRPAPLEAILDREGFSGRRLAQRVEHSLSASSKLRPEGREETEHGG